MHTRWWYRVVQAGCIAITHPLLCTCVGQDARATCWKRSRASSTRRTSGGLLRVPVPQAQLFSQSLEPFLKQPFAL